jgi:hypothetical protein
MRFARGALLALLVARAANADAPQCHVIDVDFTPSDQLQIVAWIEKPDGTFVDTIYITQKTGLYGLGNRPGRFDFNSGPVVHDMAPYGRRITTFPVWAHRHGMTWPQIEFQNNDDSDPSHPTYQSSPEANPPYCRPMMDSSSDQSFWDAGTCATPSVYTDKGVFSPSGKTSLYPPRADLVRDPSIDSPSVDMYKALNPFDSVTQATPLAGAQTEINWPIPPEVATGDYVVWVEVSKAFDFNATYNATVYPPPNVPYGDFGEPYRGQPSVVYSVPITIGSTDTEGTTQSYIGYGDPDGATGTLHPPDATITIDTPGSGAARLQIIAGTTGALVHVRARPENDTIPPAIPDQLATTHVTATTASVQFVAPGNDGLVGKVAGYEIRYLAHTEMTADNFGNGTSAPITVVPTPAGAIQSFELDGLLPVTDYWVGIRAYDDCRNMSPVAIVQLTTTDRQSGEVSACFIATAAYGSAMANDVGLLRRFRDSALRSTALGELAIETYYTFGPPVAGVVGESDLLRASARAALAPIVDAVRHFRF